MRSGSKSSGKRVEKRGPGRPRLSTQQLARRVNVTLDAATIERATRLGGGNLSAGLRKAVMLTTQTAS